MFYLFERLETDTHTHTERENLPCTDVLPKCLPQPGWIRPKLGSKNSIQTSHMDGRDLTTRVIPCYLPRVHIGRNWIGSRAGTENPGTVMWNVGIPSSI